MTVDIKKETSSSCAAVDNKRQRIRGACDSFWGLSKSLFTLAIKELFE